MIDIIIPKIIIADDRLSADGKILAGAIYTLYRKTKNDFIVYSPRQIKEVCQFRDYDDTAIATLVYDLVDLKYIECKIIGDCAAIFPTEWAKFTFQQCRESTYTPMMFESLTATSIN